MWRKAFSIFSQRPKRRLSTVSRMRGQAKYSMRCGMEKWRVLEKYPSDAITGRSTPRRSSLCWRECFDRTGDAETLWAIWPNVKAALRWIDAFGDKDGDGFVEYARRAEAGLINQGWKDSHDSI